MQDSLEDYIKLANNVHTIGTSTISSDSKEMEYKLSSNTRALKIVEFAIDGQLRPEVFIKCLNYINPAFYQDIVEERQLAQYCGYPICGHRILKKPIKQYFISTKANKIYDITDRKNFCNNFCYKANNHIKEQIESTPLWLRNEQGCPKFQLLLADEKGSAGEEVVSITKNVDETVFTSISEFAEASLDEAQESELTTQFKRLVTDQNKKRKEDELIASRNINIADKYTSDSKSNMKGVAQDAPRENDRSNLVKEFKTEVVENCKSLDKRLKMALDKVKRMKEDETKKKSNLIDTAKNPEMMEHRKAEKLCNTHDFHLKSRDIDVERLRKTDAIKTSIENISNCFTAWTTLDTFFFLHGEERIRLALTERKMMDLFNRLQVTELSIAQQVRYRDICRRMHKQDMMEEQKDGDLIGGTSSRRSRERKPLPEYRDLKKESKELTVKVKAFFSGMSYDPNSSKIKVKQISAMENSCGFDAGDNAEVVEEEMPAVLPLIDNTNRSAIRRRIFLNSANPQIRKHLSALNLDVSFMEQIHYLVHTFKLSSNNIVFKPDEWKLIGIALFEILSLNNNDLQNRLKSEFYNKYIQSEFSSILNFKNLMSGLKDHFQNVELFIELYISSEK